MSGEEPLPGRRSRMDALLARIPNGAFRLFGTIGFGVYVLGKSSTFDRYASKPLYFLETGVYVLIALSFLTRRAPQVRASGVAETLLPLLGAVMPFGLLVSPERPLSPALQAVAGACLLGGAGLAVLGYVFLRRSFAIFVEARAPVLGGPYRLIRHPVYTGQIIAATGVLIWRFSALACAVYAAVVTIQVARAHLEEKKLASAFPEYAAHRGRTWRFIPFVY